MTRVSGLSRCSRGVGRTDTGYGATVDEHRGLLLLGSTSRVGRCASQ